MSNYNNSSNPQQPSSAYTSRKQDEYHPLQNQQQYNGGRAGQDEHYELSNAGGQMDSAGRPKKRNVITEARSGITHSAQAVRGGISNGTPFCPVLKGGHLGSSFALCAKEGQGSNNKF